MYSLTALGRHEIERTIEELIAFLDLFDGDPDLEPYLADTDPAIQDREGENEHGGDVQDEPHDGEDEGNDEPNLGWSNPRCGPPDLADGWQCSDSVESACDLWRSDMANKLLPMRPLGGLDRIESHAQRGV